VQTGRWVPLAASPDPGPAKSNRQPRASSSFDECPAGIQTGRQASPVVLLATWWRRLEAQGLPVTDPSAQGQPEDAARCPPRAWRHPHGSETSQRHPCRQCSPTTLTPLLHPPAIAQARDTATACRMAQAETHHQLLMACDLAQRMDQHAFLNRLLQGLSCHHVSGMLETITNDVLLP
jgi:hypothetical protein